MTDIKNIADLLNKIEIIKWGCLKIETNNFTATNLQTVQIIKADKEGYLHFFVSGKEITKTDAEQKCYANLVFIDKLTATKIMLSGYVCKAEIESDAEEFITIGNPTIFHLKFKIMQIEITEFIEEKKKNTQPLFSNIINILQAK